MQLSDRIKLIRIRFVNQSVLAEVWYTVHQLMFPTYWRFSLNYLKSLLFSKTCIFLSSKTLFLENVSFCSTKKSLLHKSSITVFVPQVLQKINLLKIQSMIMDVMFDTMSNTPYLVLDFRVFLQRHLFQFFLNLVLNSTVLPSLYTIYLLLRDNLCQK